MKAIFARPTSLVGEGREICKAGRVPLRLRAVPPVLKEGMRWQAAQEFLSARRCSRAPR